MERVEKTKNIYFNSWTSAVVDGDISFSSTDNSLTILANKINASGTRHALVRFIMPPESSYREGITIGLSDPVIYLKYSIWDPYNTSASSGTSYVSAQVVRLNSEISYTVKGDAKSLLWTGMDLTSLVEFSGEEDVGSWTSNELRYYNLGMLFTFSIPPFSAETVLLRDIQVPTGSSVSYTHARETYTSAVLPKVIGSALSVGDY